MGCAAWAAMQRMSSGQNRDCACRSVAPAAPDRVVVAGSPIAESRQSNRRLRLASALDERRMPSSQRLAVVIVIAMVVGYWISAWYDSQPPTTGGVPPGSTSASVPAGSVEPRLWER